MTTRSSAPELATALLAAIVEASDDAIVALDAEGRITTWNRGAERLYGYAAAQAIGRPAAMLLPPDGAAAEALRRALAGEAIDRGDLVHVARDGRPVAVAFTARPVHDADGRPAGVAMIVRDSTPAARQDRALRRGEARWRAIIESAVDGIVTIDRHGRIQSFNRAAERLFGVTAAEVLGQNVSALMPAPYAAEHDAYIRRYLDTRERRIIGIGREVAARRKDGTTFPAHLSVGEASIDGEITFVGIVRDLSERVALELRLREESGLARLGELAAVLAHEVKNPLAAVSGAVQMIAERFPPGAEEREVTQEILRRLDALSALMGDLLLYARPPHPALRSIDLMALIDHLVAFFRTDPDWRDIDVALEGRAEAISADPELLKIAIQNLLLNAVQAMRGAGRLTVSVRVAEGLAEIDITDSGGGIPEEIRDRVFTPFFTTKSRGTGLGLATVRRIIESHGGRITVVASSTAGTTMRLQLPASPSSGE